MILIVGPPGAGKSVQARLLDEAHQVKWLSVGKLLREKLSGDDRHDMSKGMLVDDDVVNRYVKEALDSMPNAPVVLMDGFPRRLSQAHWLTEYLKDNHRKLTGIIHLQISEDVSLDRLKKRGRLDDSEAVVKKRYKQYLSESIPVIELFAAQGVPVHQINGDASIEYIHKQIISDIA